MSAAARTFYAIRCDYTECGTLFDGDEYTYSWSPGENGDYAAESGWLIGFEGHDYCPAHVVYVAELFEADEEADRDQPGYRPLPDTLNDRIASSVQRAIAPAMAKFDRMLRGIENDRRDDQARERQRQVRIVQKKHRHHIESDPEVLDLLPYLRRHAERTRELSSEAVEIYGRAY